MLPLSTCWDTQPDPMRQYDRPIGGELPGGIDPNRGKLETNRGELTGDRGESDAIPTELLELIQALGRKPPQARLRHVLIRLAEPRHARA